MSRSFSFSNIRNLLFLSLDFNNITFKESFELLYGIQKNIKEIYSKENN